MKKRILIRIVLGLLLLFVVGAAGILIPALTKTYPSAVEFATLQDESVAQNAVNDLPDLLPGTDIKLMPGAWVEMRDFRDKNALQLTIGPVDLLAGASDIRFPVKISSFPIDGFLHGFDWMITHGPDDDPAPARLLHHMNMVSPQTRELFVPIAQRFLAAGHETPQQVVPSIVGRPFSAGETILTVVKFDTPADQDFLNVKFHVFLYYSPGGRVVKPVSVFPFYMDVMSPMGAEGFKKDFAVPSGATSHSWEGKPGADGRILGIGGHLHDYGTSLKLEDLTSGKVLWEAVPTYTSEGLIQEVPSQLFLSRGGIKIYRDHTYRVTAEYFNPTDRPGHHGGMGALAGVLAPSTAWPEVEHDNHVFVEELTSFINFKDPEAMVAAATSSEQHMGH